jgi:hypothetical protein
MAPSKDSDTLTVKVDIKKKEVGVFGATTGNLESETKQTSSSTQLASGST